MKNLIWAFLLFPFSSHALPTAPPSPPLQMQGTLYSLKEPHEEIYGFELRTLQEGATQIEEGTYKDLSGNTVVQERLERNGPFSPSAPFQKYCADWKQTGRKGCIQIEGQKIHFQYFSDSKTRTETESIPENLVIAPTLIHTLQKNWPSLLAGETLQVRFASIERSETIGFKIFKVDSEKTDPPNTVRLKMKASSIIIAAIADPIFLVFDLNTKRLLEMTGRTFPKQKSGDSWKDLDARTVYRYPSN